MNILPKQLQARCLETCLALLAGAMLVKPANAAAILSDNFSTSTLTNTSPANPTSTSTAYQYCSSKSFATGLGLAANDLRLTMGSTSSAVAECQALFSTNPIILAATGDYIQVTVTFTNVGGLLTGGNASLGLGLYDSGGINGLVKPVPGGMDASLTGASNNVATGYAQGWKGYFGSLVTNGASHLIYNRNVQTGTTNNNQGTVTTGTTSSPRNPNPTSLTTSISASPTILTLTPGATYTEVLAITKNGANSLAITNTLYSGPDTSGSVVVRLGAIATNTTYLTSTFDSLSFGYRVTAGLTNDLSSIKVESSVVTNGSPSSNSVAGIYFQQPPTAAVAGVDISPAITVVATNSAGAPVTNQAVTLSLLSGSGSLNGTLTQSTDPGGVATFADINLTVAGAKQLRATAGSFTADSAAFNITNGPATALVFTTQPWDAAVSTVIAPPVVVQLRDAYGNDVASNATISVTLSSGTGTLSGNASIGTDAAGKSTFTNLSINLAGTKQLTATKSGLPGVASSSFNITNVLVPAFPGAEGAGAYTSGGRGGDVYYVTSLGDANTAGTLRYGINNAPAGGRTICFKVSGNIALTSSLTINKPNITVAGQTAPGDGICVQDQTLNINANNVIVRHLRSRLGTNDAVEGDCLWMINGTNIIVDHVSASWSVDEILSANNGVISNLTVQNCFVTEALQNSIHVKGAHGYGGIISCVTNATYSYLRNLYAHNDSRNPRIGSSSVGGTLRLDFRNNVIFNYGGRAGYTGGTNESCQVNYVNNYCIKGPSSTYNYILEGGADSTEVYQSGNYIDLDRDGLVDGSDTGWSMFSGAYTPTNAPFDVPAASTDSAPVAYQRVVALSGAMPWRRDANDQRIARTVRQQTGVMVDFVGATNQATDYITNSGYVGVRGWPTLAAEPAPTDSDSDGMPDYWETAVGLNPALASDRNLTNSATGYTRLEEYLNWLADAHALCDKNGTVDVSLRDATGGATNLTYAVTNGNNGSVILLGDGYTARFTAAANTNGMAGFTFTATDPVAATSFGLVNYGVLITTNLAPTTNTAPVLAAIPNRTVMAGSNISFTCSVTDTDTPPQAITFALSGAPVGATLGTNSGLFNWRPTVAQGNTTNLMSIIATDNGVPPLSATQSFTVVVLKPSAPAIVQPSVTVGSFSLWVGGDAGPDYTIQGSTNLLNWTSLFTTNQPVLPFNWSDPTMTNHSQRFYRILLGP